MWTSMTSLDARDHLEQGLLQVKIRMRAVRKHVKLLCVLGVLGNALAIAASILAYLSVPTGELESVHISEGLLRLFTDSRSGSFSQLEDMFSSPGFSNAVAILGVVILVGGMVGMVMTGSLIVFINSVVFVLMIGLVYTASTQLTQDFHPPSERTLFLNSIEDGDVDQVHDALIAKGVSASIRSYVEAQLILKSNRFDAPSLSPEQKVALRANASALGKATTEDLQRAIDPQTVYAIESAAFGHARSQIAKDSYSSALEKVVTARRISSVGLTFGLGALLIAVILAGVYRAMRNRIRRINPLLGSLNGR